jgi:hypothetical protein
MPDTLNSIRELRFLEDKRGAGGLTSEEEARWRELRALVHQEAAPSSGAPASSFDFGAQPSWGPDGTYYPPGFDAATGGWIDPAYEQAYAQGYAWDAALQNWAPVFPLSAADLIAADGPAPAAAPPPGADVLSALGPELDLELLPLGGEVPAQVDAGEAGEPTPASAQAPASPSAGAEAPVGAAALPPETTSVPMEAAKEAALAAAPVAAVAPAFAPAEELSALMPQGAPEPAAGEGLAPPLEKPLDRAVDAPTEAAGALPEASLALAAEVAARVAASPAREPAPAIEAAWEVAAPPPEPEPAPAELGKDLPAPSRETAPGIEVAALPAERAAEAAPPATALGLPPADAAPAPAGERSSPAAPPREAPPAESEGQAGAGKAGEGATPVPPEIAAGEAPAVATFPAGPEAAAAPAEVSLAPVPDFLPTTHPATTHPDEIEILAIGDYAPASDEPVEAAPSTEPPPVSGGIKRRTSAPAAGVRGDIPDRAKGGRAGPERTESALSTLHIDRLAGEPEGAPTALQEAKVASPLPKAEPAGLGSGSEEPIVAEEADLVEAAEDSRAEAPPHDAPPTADAFALSIRPSEAAGAAGAIELADAPVDPVPASSEDLHPEPVDDSEFVEVVDGEQGSDAAAGAKHSASEPRGEPIPPAVGAPVLLLGGAAAEGPRLARAAEPPALESVLLFGGAAAETPCPSPPAEAASRSAPSQDNGSTQAPPADALTSPVEQTWPLEQAPTAGSAPSEEQPAAAEPAPAEAATPLPESIPIPEPEPALAAECKPISLSQPATAADSIPFAEPVAPSAPAISPGSEPGPLSYAAWFDDRKSEPPGSLQRSGEGFPGRSPALEWEAGQGSAPESQVSGSPPSDTSGAADRAVDWIAFSEEGGTALAAAPGAAPPVTDAFAQGRSEEPDVPDLAEPDRTLFGRSGAALFEEQGEDDLIVQLGAAEAGPEFAVHAQAPTDSATLAARPATASDAPAQAMPPTGVALLQAAAGLDAPERAASPAAAESEDDLEEIDVEDIEIDAELLIEEVIETAPDAAVPDQAPSAVRVPMAPGPGFSAPAVPVRLAAVPAMSVPIAPAPAPPVRSPRPAAPAPIARRAVHPHSGGSGESATLGRIGGGGERDDFEDFAPVPAPAPPRPIAPLPPLSKPSPSPRFTPLPIPAALPRPTPAPMSAVALRASPAPAPNAIIPGEHRVVVHTLEGQVKRGTVRNPVLDGEQIDLEVAPGQPPERIATRRLKAVFFLLPPGSRGPSGEGPKLRVTFSDERQVAGFAPNYRPSDNGFFMIPSDTRTNTARIYIYRAAVKNIARG